MPDTAAKDAVLEAVEKELSKSRVLLVLCSPDAVRSDYVQQEIALWVSRYGGRSIFPLVTEGKDPAGSPQECFPPALIEGRLHKTALWYDLRAMRQPHTGPWRRKPANQFRNTEDELVRLAGDLLEWDSIQNEPLATLWEREQLRRKRRAATFAVVVAVFFIVLSTFAIYSARQATEQQRVARAAAITIAADSSPDPLLGSGLLTELQDLPQPADGLRVARKLAALEVPASVLQTSYPVIKAVLSADDRQVLAVNNHGRAVMFPVDGNGNPQIFHAPASPAPLACDASQKPYSGPDSLTDVAFSSDGSYFATSSLDGQVRIWRLGIGDPIVARAHNSPVQAVAFSPDNKWVFSSATPGTLRAISVLDGTCYSTALPNQVQILTVRFPSSDAPGLVVGIDNSLWSLSFDRGLDLRRLPSPKKAENVTGQMVVISPHAEWVLLADPFSTVWFSTMQPMKAVLKHFSPATPNAAGFSPDGRLLAIATSDGNIHIFDSSSGSEVMRPLPSSIHFLVTDIMDKESEDSAWHITHLIFNIDNSGLVATSDSGTTRIWNLKTRSVIHEMRASFAESAIFTRDEDSLVTYGMDGAVRIWRLRQEPEPQILAHDGPVEFAGFLLDGRALVTRTRDHKAYFWLRNSKRAAPLDTGGAQVNSLRLLNHAVIAVVPDRIFLWRTDDTGKLSPAKEFYDAWLKAISGAEASRVGDKLVVWSPDGRVMVWPLNSSGSPRKATLGHSLPQPLRWNSTLTRALSRWQGKLQLWDFQDFEHPRALLERDDKPIQQAYLSGSGNKAVLTMSPPGAIDRRVTGICRIVYFDRGQKSVDLKFSTADDWLDGCFLSPDESSAIVTSGQGRAWLFDLAKPATPQELHDESGFAHQGMMADPVFSADGKRIVTFGSIDGNVKIWSLPEGTADVLEGHGAAILAGAVSPDMSLVVSASEDKTARVWRAAWKDMLHYLRARTNANLTIQQRMHYLGESEKTAQKVWLQQEEMFHRTWTAEDAYKTLGRH
jgi:WD40 repeat protein